MCIFKNGIVGSLPAEQKKAQSEYTLEETQGQIWKDYVRQWNGDEWWTRMEERAEKKYQAAKKRLKK